MRSTGRTTPPPPGDDGVWKLEAFSPLHPREDICRQCSKTIRFVKKKETPHSLPVVSTQTRSISNNAGDLTELIQLDRVYNTTGENTLEALAKIRNNWVDLSVLQGRQSSKVDNKLMQQQQQPLENDDNRQLEVIEEKSTENTFFTNSVGDSESNSIVI